MNRALLSLSLAFDFFKAELGCSDQRLQRWTQLVLLFFLLTLALTSHSIQRHLDNNLENLLGADISITSYQPLTADALSLIDAESETVANLKLMDVTLTKDERWERVQLKVVGANYPLQGELMVSPDVGSIAEPRNAGPVAGEIWVDSRVMSQLALTIGDSLSLGQANFRLTGIITHEPDRLTEGHSVALRAMINATDLECTELPLKNARHRYLLAVADKQIDDLLESIAGVAPSAELRHRKGGHPLALFWQRTENFLGLSSVLLFLMAAIAIDLSSRRRIQSEKRLSAVCQSMGMSRTESLSVNVMKWHMGYFMMVVPALALSLLAQEFIINELRTLLPDLTSEVSLVVIAKQCGLLLLLMLLFQLPSWLTLARVSIADLLQDRTSGASTLLRAFWSLSSVALLASIYSDNPLLTGMTIGSMLGVIVLMMGLTWLSLTLGEKLTKGLSGFLPFTFYIMKQRLLSKATQIMGVGLCATLLLFSLVMLKDIGASMQQYTRTQDGNLLVSKATESEMQTLLDWGKTHQSEVRAMKPYLPGKLLLVNGKTLSEHRQTPSSAMATVQRQVRIHLTDELPRNNRVTDGAFWHMSEPFGAQDWQRVSVEDEVMTDLSLTLGDTLSFQIGNESYEFVIVASHAFKSGGGSLTFWFQVPSYANEVINETPMYMASMELNDDAWKHLATIWQTLPTINMVSLAEMTKRFDDTLATVNKLIGGFSVMISLMALIVIAASAKGFEELERRKNGLMLSFGLTRKDCLKLTLYEWLITASIAAVGAIVGSWGTAVLIYEEQFSMTYTPDPLWLMVTLSLTLTVVCVAGLLSSRSSLASSTKTLLAYE